MFLIVDGTKKIGGSCIEGGRMTLSDGVRGAEQSSSRSQKMETHYKTNSGHQRALVPYHGLSKRERS